MAFNADEYKQSLDPLFPGIRFSIGMSESYARQAMPVLEHNLNAYLENDYGRMLNNLKVVGSNPTPATKL